MNKTTIKSKNKIFANNESVFSTDKFSNSESHSTKTTTTAKLKILERYLLSANAESRKITVKQILYKSRCNKIGKKGIIKIVKITISNKTELLVVRNLFDMFERKFILWSTLFH